jgi:hypothetical protein
MRLSSGEIRCFIEVAAQSWLQRKAVRHPRTRSKGTAMITASQLTILVAAIALVCVISLMLHMRAEATRKRVDAIERRMDALAASVAKEVR